MATQQEDTIVSVYLFQSCPLAVYCLGSHILVYGRRSAALVLFQNPSHIDSVVYGFQEARWTEKIVSATHRTAPYSETLSTRKGMESDHD
jgi:hypothetical protein